MKVTAIVCVHNNLNWLSQALESIAAQTRQVQEVVMVKSEQTPAEADVLAEQFGVEKLVAQQEPGLAAARNLGIRVAQHEVIVFLDSDDFWDSEKTAVQLSHLGREHTEAVIGSLIRFSEAETLEPVYKEAHFLKPVPAMTPGGLLVKKSVFLKIGMFDNRYRIACDHEWFMRLTEAPVRLKKIPEIVLHKRIHGSNLSNQTAAYRQELMNILKNRYR